MLYGLTTSTCTSLIVVAQMLLIESLMRSRAIPVPISRPETRSRWGSPGGTRTLGGSWRAGTTQANPPPPKATSSLPCVLAALARSSYTQLLVDPRVST